MSFLIYFFVLLVSAASVLFGLDLMSAPLQKTPNVPIGRSVQVASTPPAQQREARVADERVLTPVYPTDPGKPKVPAETTGSALQEQQQQATLTPAPAAPVAPAPVATAAPAPSVAQAPQPQPVPAAQAPAPVAQAPQPQPAASVAQPQFIPEVKQETVATTQPAPTPVMEAKMEPAISAQPAVQQAPNSCKVQACGAAYQSFRAADCSYQPSAGPRRACTLTRGAATASSPKSKQVAREATGEDDLRDVERIVKRQPLQLTPAPQAAGNGEMREVERIVRHMTRNESGDVAVQDGDGNIIVVRKTVR